MALGRLDACVRHSPRCGQTEGSYELGVQGGPAGRRAHVRETARDNLADELNSRADAALATFDGMRQRKNGDPGGTGHAGRIAAVLAILRRRLREIFLRDCGPAAGADDRECGCEGILLQQEPLPQRAMPGDQTGVHEYTDDRNDPN